MDASKVFEIIQGKYAEKKITSLCKKLIKKCSFDSGADVQNLCHLAYWLFVLGYNEDALVVCELTHNVNYPGKGGYNVWDFIMYIWGLEVHILKNDDRLDEAKSRIDKMNAIWMLEPMGKFEEERRNRFTLSVCSREKEIINATSETSANKWKFLALFHLIGYGSTGLFPDLEKNKSIVQERMDGYIQTLKK